MSSDTPCFVRSAATLRMVSTPGVPVAAQDTRQAHRVWIGGRYPVGRCLQLPARGAGSAQPG